MDHRENMIYCHSKYIIINSGPIWSLILYIITKWKYCLSVGWKQEDLLCLHSVHIFLYIYKIWISIWKWNNFLVGCIYKHIYIDINVHIQNICKYTYVYIFLFIFFTFLHSTYQALHRIIYLFIYHELNCCIMAASLCYLVL